MTAREYARIESAAAELRSQAETMTNDRDRENLLHRADALEWVLSIAERPDRPER